MKDWKKAVVPLDGTMRDVIHSLNESAQQMVLVVDGDWRLKGVITDGDIRRGLLAGLSLESAASQVMNTKFFFTRPEDDEKELLETMQRLEFHHAPVLDADGRLLGLRNLFEMVSTPRRDNWVVLMAGGLGSRLRPLTEDCPKPLLPVGGRPILETILLQFAKAGFWNFFISVKFRAEMVEGHFGDGSKFGVQITYLREEEPLGTAGSLGLLPAAPTEPVFVMNGDLLTRINLVEMLAFHREHRASATMAVRKFEMQVPYGVVEVADNFIRSIQEKPTQCFFVNGGIYVLDPGVIATEIPKNRYLDMPSLFTSLVETGRITAAFPVHEYWMDIGQRKDFDQANSDYFSYFCATGD